jgi:predicted DCC family thiol-disulfide oxidoreductase YuxK
MSRARVIFDGDCGICQWSVRRAHQWVKADVQFIAWQEADLADMGLTPEECHTAVQWIGSNGRRYSGAVAVAHTLQSGRQPWRVIGAMLDSAPMRPLSGWVYRWVARNRANQCVNPGMGIRK